jgi:hypothetical protein
MLRFSVSGAFLVIEVLQSSASIVSTESIATVGCTLVLAAFSVLPEITRLADTFFKGSEPEEAA